MIKAVTHFITLEERIRHYERSEILNGIVNAWINQSVKTGERVADFDLLIINAAEQKFLLVVKVEDGA